MSAGILGCVFLPFGLIVLDLYLKRRRNPSGFPYPPGPRQLPLVGNLFDIPERKAWETYARWASQYGDIISIQALGQTVVIIHSAKIARDLLEKRGSVYSDRPVVPAFDLMKLDFNMLMERYGTSKWKIVRKLVDHNLRPSAIVAYRPMQIRRAHQFLRKLLHSDDIMDDIRHMTTAVIMSLTYGYEIAESNDKFVANVDEIVERASKAVLPGATLINVFPLLGYLPAWLPGMSFKRDALRHIDQVNFAVEAPFAFTKGEIHKGIAQPSFIMESMNPSSGHNLAEAEEHALKQLSATLYIGSETSNSVLGSFFLAIIKYPDVQKRAQDELDIVVGRDRLPDFEDKERLPYIMAICQELMRWRMVTPLGIVHSTTEDDVYERYFIPKGSHIWVNAWSMLHDPAAYPDPDEFRPERFLAPDGTVIEDPLLTSAFGWGRRLCPGRFLADANIWIIIVSVLSAFSVRKAKDAEGRDIPVEAAYTDQGIACQPLPFQCAVVPRDARAEQLVADTSFETY